jgi:hypothetical protein
MDCASNICKSDRQTQSYPFSPKLSFYFIVPCSTFRSVIHFELILWKI